MKKNVCFFLLCFFAIIGMAQAQNRGEIQLKATEMNHVMISQDQLPAVGSWFSYVGDYSSPSIIGIGMPFNWGYMLPSTLMKEYNGCTITEFGFLDAGEEQFATNYTVNIYLGGDTAPGTLVSTQEFEITGTVGDVVTFRLDTPVEIDGMQNIWLTFYNDGSIQYPAPAVADVGNPNSRWLGIDGYGWMDMASVTSEVYSWLAWVYIDGYDWMGESNESVSVYPNPTSGNVNVVALGTNHITVMNALGQVVYDANADRNVTALDMSQFQAGVYMVRVTTENGESVKRISVVK
jgi:hypothetical protein